MINDIIITLETAKDKLNIKVNGRIKKSINIENKIINTKEIYDMLNYKTENNYILNSNKLKDEDTKGKDNEINRLYNYVYELLNTIIHSINDINKNDKA